SLTSEMSESIYSIWKCFRCFLFEKQLKIHSFFTFTRIKKSTAGIFIMSLAGTNILTCLLVMPFTRAVVYLNERVRFDVARKIYMFFIKCNVKIALFKTMAIAIDRYVVVIVSCIYIWNYRIKLSYGTHTR
ncbi:hypothetical protein MAR_005193, partial [Mya arenaria]